VRVLDSGREGLRLHSDGAAEGVLQRDVALTRLGNISIAPSRDVACALFRDMSLAAFRVSQKRELAQTC
jgi:hypothetical protein